MDNPETNVAESKSNGEEELRKPIGLKTKPEISRRDYIAALAMQALIAQSNPEARNIDNIVGQAVEIADALIGRLG